MTRKLISLLPISDGEKDLRLDPGPQAVPIVAIRLRTDDTRGLNAPHVVALAESIAVLGLLEPIVIDRQGRLLAGAHRLAAVQLLAHDDDDTREREFMGRIDNSKLAKDTVKAGGTELCKALATRVHALGINRRQDCPTKTVPVLVVDVKGDDDTSNERRLAVEVAENNVRRPYSATEIKALAKRLKAAGYKATPGRRKKADFLRPTLITVLQAAVGRSRRTIERIISKQPVNKKSDWENARQSLFRVARRLQAEGKKGQHGEDDRKLLTAVERLLALGGMEGPE